MDVIRLGGKNQSRRTRSQDCWVVLLAWQSDSSWAWVSQIQAVLGRREGEMLRPEGWRPQHGVALLPACCPHQRAVTLRGFLEAAATRGCGNGSSSRDAKGQNWSPSPPESPRCFSWTSPRSEGPAGFKGRRNRSGAIGDIRKVPAASLGLQHPSSSPSSASRMLRRPK